MKNLFLSVVLCLVALFDVSAECVYSDSVVRFSLISPGAVRMEYAPDGKFVNDSSLLIVNRSWPGVTAHCDTVGGWLTFSTPEMRVRYRLGSGKFGPDNLSVQSLRSDVSFTWHPGMEQKENLKGTARTLDGIDGDTYSYAPPAFKLKIDDGLLARDGWTLVDDSRSPLFDKSPWPWAVERQSHPDAQDWYFLVYGHDYKKALADFTRFAGKIPLPPRFAFGYWWSRYWAYSDSDFRSLVSEFRKRDIPLDVMVIDMDWHYSEPPLGAWTGYTWNRTLIPDPEGLLGWLHDNNLKVTLNLHPAGDIIPCEENYASFARDMGIDPSRGDTVEFLGSSKRFMNAWFNSILAPIEKQGVDFWWLDWQQWEKDKAMPLLDNVFWLNHLFFTRMASQSKSRPILYHRWGGLGNHRYQIGFSGDTEITWNSLDFQPWFNSTASNVLYGYWSHDIGGHYGGIGHIDPEMFIRWMQFGVFSPVLRTHSTKDENLKKEPWNFSPEHYGTIVGLIRRRYALAPYIYTMARRAYDTGVSLCRPMYYDYPESPEAYTLRNQYMFGDNMMVRPVTSPADSTGRVTVSVWLPGGGDWFDVTRRVLLPGGQTVEGSYALDEIPLFVKAGSVLPLSPGLRSLSGSGYPVEFNIYPGTAGEFDFYEDVGDSPDYADRFATTHIASAFSGNTLLINISPREGSYAGMPASRTLSIRVHGRPAPKAVKVDGKKVRGTYDALTRQLTFTLPPRPLSSPRHISVTYP